MELIDGEGVEEVFSGTSVEEEASTQLIYGWEFVGGLTCRFCASLKHKDDGQTKFIKPNSQRQDIIIKYWVSIGSIHKEQG